MPRENRPPIIITPTQVQASERLVDERELEQTLVETCIEALEQGGDYTAFRLSLRDEERELLDRSIELDGTLTGRGRHLLGHRRRRS